MARSDPAFRFNLIEIRQENETFFLFFSGNQKGRCFLSLFWHKDFLCNQCHKSKRVEKKRLIKGREKERALGYGFAIERIG